MNGTESLEKIKLWLQIVATIALPIIVFVVGNQVQRSIATQELGKSYVQMAIDVLKTPPTPENSELRQWAVATVDKHSPIPLSKELREQLKQGAVEFKIAAKNDVEAKDDQTTVGGIVKYIKCEKVQDAETAQWMIKNIQNVFKKCPSEDEVGITQFKKRNGPLKDGETQLFPLGPTNAVASQKMERSVQCVKTRDKGTAEWLLKNYGNTVFRCPKPDEIGVMKLSTTSK